MAYEIPGFSYTLPSGQDYTASKQFRFVSISATGTAVDPAAGGSVMGVRQTRPRLGEETTIVQTGIVFVEAGAALTPGQSVMTNALGQAVPYAAGVSPAVNRGVGVALETASGSGIQIAVLLTPLAATA